MLRRWICDTLGRLTCRILGHRWVVRGIVRLPYGDVPRDERLNAVCGRCWPKKGSAWSTTRGCPERLLPRLMLAHAARVAREPVDLESLRIRYRTSDQTWQETWLSETDDPTVSA